MWPTDKKSFQYEIHRQLSKNTSSLFRAFSQLKTSPFKIQARKETMWKINNVDNKLIVTELVFQRPPSLFSGLWDSVALLLSFHRWGNKLYRFGGKKKMTYLRLVAVTAWKIYIPFSLFYQHHLLLLKLWDSTRVDCQKRAIDFIFLLR